jgi:hypothetical protein
MWYKIASKNNEPDFESNKIWFEIVPENIWIVQDSNIKIIKAVNIKNNLPSSIFKVLQENKEINNFDKLDTAKDFAEELNAKKLPKKDTKN